MRKLNKLFKFFVCALPVVLFFSYEPVMRLGEDATMYFELSLPLIWLVMFDMLAVVMMVWRKVLFRGFDKWWMWLLFPVWALVSVAWSLNMTRGVLTVGVLWLLWIAIYGMWQMRELFDTLFWRRFFKWFIGASLVVCGVCWLQCILDLVGVGREYSLICQGCTYSMFGFPHPDGFSIEPQFMGNLLLAPMFVTAWMWIKRRQNSKDLERERSRDGNFHNRAGGLGPVFQYRILVRACCKNYNGSRSLGSKSLLFCLFVIVATLFLTFSRGAIYAMVVGLVVMSGWVVVEAGKKRKEIVKRVVAMWGVVILCFAVVLNVQGLMAAVSPTNDTYKSGVSKVLNHLSLGVIDRGELVENYVENSEEKVVEKSEEKLGEQAIFDGYVAESTDTRLRLAGAGLKVWAQDASTMIFGVGLGGAGQALYNNGLSPAPREIVQNQYVSVLLETGLVGVFLLLLTVVLLGRIVLKSKMKIMAASLIVAYAISLCFFSGLPNALHIYLLTAVFLLW